MKLVAQISLSLDEQIPIHGMFLVDRHILLHRLAGDLGPDGFDINNRAGVDIQMGSHAARIAIVIHLLELDSRHEPVVALIFPAYVIHALTRTALRNRVPAANDAPPPPGGSYDLVHRHFEVALDDRGAIFCARPALHDEVNVRLLGSGIILDTWLQLVLVVAVVDQQFSQPDFRLGHVLLVKRLAQLEPRGIGHLPGIGRIRYPPVCRDAPHEPAISGDEAHNHAITTRLGVNLYVFVAPGGV